MICDVGSLRSSVDRSLILVTISLIIVTCPVPVTAEDSRRDGPGICAAREDTRTPLKFLDVPSGSIFGFTEGTDVGEPGECDLSVELTGRVGKRSGRYFAGTTKYEFEATVLKNLELAVAPLTSWYSIRGVPDVENRSAFVFDGLSAEARYRILTRSPSNRLAVTIAAEPHWERTDPVDGRRTKAYGTEFRLFIDAALDPRWFAALNLGYIQEWEKEAGDPHWKRFSATELSLALTWGPDGQDSTWLFGAESRYLAAFNGLALGHRLSQAWFVGPTMLVRLGESASLNVAWTPQIRGHARGSSGKRDLDTFERHQFRVKLAVDF